MKRAATFAGAVALGAVALAPVAISSKPAPAPSAIEIPVPDAALPATYSPAASFAPLVEAVEPAVASIEVEGVVPGRSARDLPPEMQEFFGRFMGEQPPRVVKGEGSGFVISADGLLLTNHHVVDGARTIRARFTDGTLVDAELVGSDARTDVALLQLPKDRAWPHVELGDSDGLRVGDWVLAVGNPLGLGSTVTAGIISGKGRNLGNNPYDEFLQTDAAINRGNSGGPLFALDGSVVGMNTAIIQYANTVGFSVPSSVIRRVIDDLREDGRVSRGYLGTALQPLDAQLARALGLDDTDGALITEVQPGSAAEDAGLRSGDVILSVNDEEVDDTASLVRAIGRHRSGEKVQLHTWRDGKARVVKVKLGQRPDAEEAEAPATREPPASAEGPLSRLGIEARAFRPVDSGLPDGVRVTRVDAGSPAEGRLLPSDLIVAANRVRVSDVKALSDVLAAAGKTVLLEIRRGDARRFVAVEIGG